MRLTLSSPSRMIAKLAAATLVVGGAVVATSSPAGAASCSDIEVVSARGTSEPGMLGIIVGDPVYSALRGKIRNKTLQAYAVDYPASVLPGSASLGNTDLVNRVKTQAAACPNQSFILVGYSQGANVVDNSIGISSEGAAVGGPITGTIPASIEPRVKAILLFGNPIRAIGKRVTGTYQSRTLDICAQGDIVCGGGTSVAAHLTYGQNAQEAATFAAGKV